MINQDKGQTGLIAVFGGGLVKDAGVWRLAGPGEVGDVVGITNDRWRVLAACELWRQRPGRSLLVQGGRGELTAVLPPGLTLARVLKEALLDLGIPPEQILEEDASSNTLEQLRALASLVRRGGWSEVDIVSSDWHRPRIQALIDFASPLRGQLAGAVIHLVGAEQVLEVRSDEWRSQIEAERRSGHWRQRLALESRGIAAIKDGIYQYRQAPSGLIFRPALLADAETLWQWRNDPETRRQSVNTDEVPWPDHLTWLEKSLANPRRKLLIAEAAGQPVGTVRFDEEADSYWELSWAVAPEARGRGLGGRIVSAAAGLYGLPLRAKIKIGNPVSHKVARRAGFIKQTEREGMTFWTRQLS